MTETAIKKSNEVVLEIELRECIGVRSADEHGRNQERKSETFLNSKSLLTALSLMR